MSRIDAVLESARAKLARIEARDVPAALERGALLVDIRPAAQRAQEGEVAAALVIERNVLEWRCDPTSDARLPQAVDDDVEWVVLCSEGYTSSLAAAALRRPRPAPRHRRDRRLPRTQGGGRTGALLSQRRHSSERSSGRSASVLAGVQPGGCMIAAHALATSRT